MLGALLPIAGSGGRSGKRLEAVPFRKFLFTLALNLGMSVKRLLEEVDSRELSEWWAYHRIHPLPDSWKQSARICRTIMAASGNYKRIPDEEEFIPGQRQSHESMLRELSKLTQK